MKKTSSNVTNAGQEMVSQTTREAASCGMQ